MNIIELTNRMNKRLPKVKVNDNILLCFSKLNIALFLAAFILTASVSCFGDYDQILREKRDLYEQIKQFVDNNQDFYRNDEQYFMLAELSSDIYRTDQPNIPLGYYRKVLELNPNFAAKDEVLYNIGHFSAEAVRLEIERNRSQRLQQSLDDSDVGPVIRWDDEYRISEDKQAVAIKAYSDLLKNHPDSDFYSEALYAIAHIYYEIAIDADQPREYYQRAKDFFNILAEREGDRNQQFGLYQRGWSHYSTNNYERAIQDFSKILNIVDEKTLWRSYFEQDAINNIAFSLDRMDGGAYYTSSQSAIFFRENILGLINKDTHIKEVVDRVVANKLDLESPLHALNYYETYLSLFPLFIDNPLIIDSMATIYRRYHSLLPGVERDDVTEIIYDLRMVLINDYDSESGWYQANADKDIEKQLGSIRGAYHSMEPVVRNRFANEITVDNLMSYKELIQKYDQFPVFRDSTDFVWVKEGLNNVVIGFRQLADIKDTPEAYYKSWQQYAIFNNRYPHHKQVIDYEANSYYVFDRFYRALMDAEEADTIYEVEGLPETFTLEELEDLYLAETERYLNVFATDEHFTEQMESDIVSALYSRSLIYLRREQLINAERDLIAVLDYSTGEALAREIYIHLADINESFNNYERAESYWRSAAQYATDNSDKEDILNNARVQVANRANSLVADSSFTDAADDYLRLAEEFRGTDRENYIWSTQQAAELYLKAGQYQKSIDILLGMRDTFSLPDSSYSLYYAAWSIADTLLADSNQVRGLQEEFISRHPSSNPAYQTHNLIVLDEAKDNQTKYDAAERLYGIHNAVAEDESSMDIGGDTLEGIYLNAIALWSDSLAVDYDEDYRMARLLEFEKLYPEHELANTLLVDVWLSYDERGMEEERDELARYIFTKDPNSTLYADVARRDLREVYDEVNALYGQEQYDEMLEKIAEFKSIHDKYIEENIDLDLSSIYQDFEFYEDHYRQIQRFDAFIAEIKSDLDTIEDAFVNKTPNELLRVRQSSEWQTFTERDVQQRFTAATNNQIEEVTKILQKINEFETETGWGLPQEIRSRAVYMLAKTYDHAMYVIETQFDRFLNTAQEMRLFKEHQPEVFEQFVATTFPEWKQWYVNDYKNRSIPWYDRLWTLTKESDYEDEYTEMAIARLDEWGLLVESLSLYTGIDWQTVKADRDILHNIDSYVWNAVIVPEEYPFEENVAGLENSLALPIWFSTSEAESDTLVFDDVDYEDVDGDATGMFEQDDVAAYFLKRFVIDGEVQEAHLKFAANEKSTVWINDNRVASDITVGRNDDDDITYAQTVVIDANHFVQGENTIVIKSETKSQQPGILFNLDITFSR